MHEAKLSHLRIYFQIDIYTFQEMIFDDDVIYSYFHQRIFNVQICKVDVKYEMPCVVFFSFEMHGFEIHVITRKELCAFIAENISYSHCFSLAAKIHHAEVGKNGVK